MFAGAGCLLEPIPCDLSGSHLPPLNLLSYDLGVQPSPSFVLPPYRGEVRRGGQDPALWARKAEKQKSGGAVGFLPTA